jgi:hypothetical protein
LKKVWKHLYQPYGKEVVLVGATQNFLMIDDKGDPNTAKEYEV